MLKPLKFSATALSRRAVIAVHPRGDIETQRAIEILEHAGPVELRSADLENQSMEHAASRSNQTVIPNARKFLARTWEAVDGIIMPW
jgi:hypothetical protein